MMKTTFDLPQHLLSEAMSLTNARTKTQTVIIALEELVKKIKLQELKSFKGQLELDINLDTLRKRN